MNTRKYILRTCKLVGKFLTRVIFYLAVALLLVLLLVQIKPIRTSLVQYFLSSVADQVGHQMTIKSVEIAWFDRVHIHDLLLLDHTLDTMLYAKKMTFNYRIIDLIHQDFLKVQEISAHNIQINLLKYDSVSKFNLSQFIDTFRSKEKDHAEAKPVKVEEVNFHNFALSIRDSTRESREGRLNLSDLDLHFSSFLLNELLLVRDSIQLQIVELEGKERKTDFEIVHCQADFLLSQQLLSLTHLYLETGSSYISDSIELYYNGLENLSHFVDSVSFAFHLSGVKISEEDIRLFVGDVGLKSDVMFDGEVWGTVKDFSMDQFRMRFGDESFIEGGMICSGLPQIKSTFLLADITDSHIVTEDLKPYVGKMSDNVAQLGKIDFTGSFAGFLNDFVAEGDFVTEKGAIHSDINLKIPEDSSAISYKGHLELKNVDMGAFLHAREMIQNVNMKGSIEGKGTRFENAQFDLEAVITHSGFYGYAYDTIYADGDFAAHYFKGRFSVKDPNCRMSGYADLDIGKEEAAHLMATINVDTANLYALQVSDKPVFLSGDMALDISNLHIDRFIGEVKISEGLLYFEDRSLYVDSLRLSAENSAEGMRRFHLDMPGINAQMRGAFQISDVLNDLSIMTSNYVTFITLAKDALVRQQSEVFYQVEASTKVGDISPYLQFLNVPLQVSEGAFVELNFRKSKHANIFIYMAADSIRFGNMNFIAPYLEVNGSEDLDRKGILTSFIFESENQQVEGFPETDHLLIEGVWSDHSLDFSASVRQDSSKSNLSIRTQAQLYEDSIKIQFLPSNLFLFDDTWTINPENQISIYSDKITFENLTLYYQTGSLDVSGVYSNDLETSLLLTVNKLDLGNISLFTPIDADGWLNGCFHFSGNGALETLRMNGEFGVTTLTLNDLLIGNVKGTSTWNLQEKSLFSDLNIKREAFESIHINGHYYPLDTSSQLAMRLTFDQGDLSLIQPFVEEKVSNLSGYAAGKLAIKGLVTSPTITGKMNISDGNLTLNYFNTSYAFSGQLDFLPDLLVFRNFNLQDRQGSVASIEGKVSHNAFTDILLDVSLGTNNFQFLNTTALDNDLYYGTAYGTGLVKISGALNDLLVRASIKTESNTRFFVPVVQAGGSVARQEYISFLDFTDSVKIGKPDRHVIRGVSLDFDIDITPEAYCELIFDIKTGDIIRGRGNGNLKLTLNTEGEFHMFGPLEITQGAYNFTVPGFINKEFEVNPNSRISWYGDPYGATIDLDATYQQRASFEELKPLEKRNQSQVANRVPVNVLLSLDGNMLSPNIDFDLEIAQEIDVQDDRQALLAQLTSDEQELRRQVISLLFFKRFSPKSSFVVSGNEELGSSLSEYLSNQMSYLFSQLNDNLEVEIDLASLDDETFNTLQLRLAYTFLDGRLIVTRGGGFSSQEDEDNRTLKDIIGDWSVEYRLTHDGMFRLKVFSSTSNQRTGTVQNVQTQESGVSLRFVHSFNDFRKLLSRSRQDAIRRGKKKLERQQTVQGISPFAEF